MTIQQDIEALEKAFAFAEDRPKDPMAYEPFFAAADPDRIRRLLDALKECQKWHRAARLLHEPREAKLSKALDLLKEMAPRYREAAEGFGEPDEMSIADCVDEFLKENEP